MSSTPFSRAIVPGFRGGIAAFVASLITSDTLELIVLTAVFAGISAWLLERMLLPNLPMRGT
jgi:hypothetical protein